MRFTVFQAVLNIPEPIQYIPVEASDWEAFDSSISDVLKPYAAVRIRIGAMPLMLSGCLLDLLEGVLFVG